MKTAETNLCNEKDYTEELNNIPMEAIKRYFNNEDSKRRDEDARTDVAIEYYKRNRYRYSITDKKTTLEGCVELFKNCDMEIIRELRCLYENERSHQNQKAYDDGFRDGMNCHNHSCDNL